MSTYRKVDRVLLKCSCNSKMPICRLYFCRHCLKLRCGGCDCRSVSHEVDSHYCPNCLENMPAAEAKMKKNRCMNCYDCPSCGHTLSTRATNISTPEPASSKGTPKKVFYLACGVCRWMSRDVGIADMPAASGCLQERENPNAKEISTVLSYYKELAQQEKAEKERKKFIRKGRYYHLSDKYGLLSVVGKKRAGLLSAESLSLKEGMDKKSPEIRAQEASSQVEPLSEDFYTKDCLLAEVTSLKQRMYAPEFQPDRMSVLYPRHKHLLVKRSLRCKECEHNLIKPEFNPSSIKYKIHLVAQNHIPEVCIKSVPKLVYNKECEIELTMCNPVENVTHVTLLPSNDEDQSAKVELPTCQLVLAAFDDAAELADQVDTTQYNDDPNVVTFRHSNKIGFKLRVTPVVESGDVWVTCLMKHDYTNTTATLKNESRDIKTHVITHQVYVNIGSI